MEPPEPPEAPAVEICTDADVASERSDAGVDVVLIAAEGVSLVVGRPGPGRVAVFVGVPAGAADRAAAATMGAELFGA